MGNVRLSYANIGSASAPQQEIIEENNYFPFGLKHRGYNTQTSSSGNDVAQRWKFGGKELDESLGLGTYDFGARNYNPEIGRWMNLDPLAELSRRYSPYTYALDNPIYFIDPDGMQVTDWYRNSGGAGVFTDWYRNSDGKIVFDEDIKSQSDLDNAGIEGEYIAESFTGIDQSQGVYKFNEDGTVDSSSQDKIGEGDKVVAIETSTGEMIEQTSPTKGEQFVKEAGAAVVLSQGDGPVPGPADVLAAGMLLNAVKNLIIPQKFVEGYHNLEFSKKKSKGSDYGQEAEHTKGKRSSTKTKHERGQTRKGRDKGGEKGDKRRRRYK